MHPDLWYKIRVLLYDPTNPSHNPASEVRTFCAADELHISSSYFTPEETALVKATRVEKTRANDYKTVDEATEAEEPAEFANSTDLGDSSSTIEEQIKLRLANFFEKRRASGDSRP